jgi:hypothetical protein
LSEVMASIFLNHNRRIDLAQDDAEDLGCLTWRSVVQNMVSLVREPAAVGDGEGLLLGPRGVAKAARHRGMEGDKGPSAAVWTEDVC